MTTQGVGSKIRSGEEYVGAGPIVAVALAISIGVLAAIAAMPSWAPGLAGTLMGSSPKAYWFLSRGLAMAATLLLWASIVLGLLITDKISSLWPGAAAAFAIHEYVSLLGIAFAGFHALVLLGDRYIGFTLVDLVVPFAPTSYRPFWVGLGQVALYLWIVVAGSFYVRRIIGQILWKLIHYASFFTFVISMMHGISAGTDTATWWAQTAYWAMGGSVFFLTSYRIAAALSGPEHRSAARPVSRPPEP